MRHKPVLGIDVHTTLDRKPNCYFDVMIFTCEIGSNATSAWNASSRNYITKTMTIKQCKTHTICSMKCIQPVQPLTASDNVALISFVVGGHLISRPK